MCMRLVYAADLHGDIDSYRSLLALAVTADARAAIVVGRPSSVVDDGLYLAGFACVPLTPFSIKDFERRDDRPLPPFSFGMAYTSWSGEIQPTHAEALAARPSIAEALATLAEQSDPQ